MKNFIKKTVTIMLMVILIVPKNVYGYDVEGTMDGVELQYVNTGSVNATLLINSGTATCKAINVMTKSNKSKTTMTLQKSTDKSSYSKVERWSKEYTGTGTKTLTKSYTVKKGYYYRLKVVIRVYSGSEVIEKITKYSNVVQY